MLLLGPECKESEEVYYCNKDIISLSNEDLDYLIELAKKTSRQRVRLCCHSSPKDKVHEMVIIHPRHAYVRPHKHLNKAESMIVLRGEVDYITFNEEGKIEKVINMGDSTTSKPFYQSIRHEVFHTLLIKSKWLAFLEVTEGPFKKEDTVFSKWSLENPTPEEKIKFIESLTKHEGK